MSKFMEIGTHIVNKSCVKSITKIHGKCGELGAEVKMIDGERLFVGLRSSFDLDNWLKELNR